MVQAQQLLLADVAMAQQRHQVLQKSGLLGLCELLHGQLLVAQSGGHMYIGMSWAAGAAFAKSSGLLYRYCRFLGFMTGLSSGAP